MIVCVEEGTICQEAYPSHTNVIKHSLSLCLQRQQFAVAQEMFKESPSLTREQKALILGFMAGSRGEQLIQLLKSMTCKIPVCHELVLNLLIVIQLYTVSFLSANNKLNKLCTLLC